MEHARVSQPCAEELKWWFPLTSAVTALSLGAVSPTPSRLQCHRLPPALHLPVTVLALARCSCFSVASERRTYPI